MSSSFFSRLAVALGASALAVACSEETVIVPAATPPSTETPAATEDPEAPPPDDKPAAPSEVISKGCGIAPAGVGAVAKKQTTANGKQRTYHLAVPDGVKTNQKLPLVFVLHGATDTQPENMKDWFGVADKMKPAVLSVYPQALPRTRADGSGGNVTRWDLSGNDDLSFFDVMVKEISDAYCVDRAAVFVTGFSSGGNFSQHLACNRQKDVKGMGVVAGPGPFSNSCNGAVPTWMTHDADDMGLPVKDARSSRDFWAAENGCAKSAWTAVAGRPECQRNTSCPSSSPIVYCETTGVGHEVPPFAVEGIASFFDSLRK